MASISANGSKGHHKFTLTVTQSKTDIATNTSTLSFDFKLSPLDNGGWDWAEWGQNITYTITVNGTSYTGYIPDYNGTSVITLKSGTQSVTHDADGSKQIPYSFSVTDGTGAYYTSGNASASGTFVLTTIPRATTPTFSAKSVTMGNSITITINPAASTFKHKLRYVWSTLTHQIDGFSVGADFTTQGDLTVTFTPPTSLANYIPNNNSGICIVQCYTYDANGSHIGTVETEITLAVPSYTPTVSIQVGQYNTLSTVLVQNKSTLSVVIEASSLYGATITDYSSVVDNIRYSGQTFQTLPLSSGNKTIVTTVTDSRGKTATFTSGVYVVYAYIAPQITSFALERQSDNTTVIATVKGRISAINNKNAKTIKVILNGVTNTITSSTYIINGTTTFTNVPTDVTLIGSATFTDSYVTIKQDSVLPTVAVTMDFLYDGKGVAFGKVAETSNLLDVAWAIKSSGIKSQRGTRPTSANISPETDYYGCMENYLASNSMTEGKPMTVDGQTASTHDGHILHFHWDNGGKYDAQLYLKNSNGSLLTRGCNAGTWSAWKQMLDTSLCKDYVIEQGTSDGWNYTKWKNGKIELYGDKSLTFPAGTTVATNLNRSIVTIELSSLLTTIIFGVCPVQYNGMIPQFCRHTTYQTRAEVVILTSRSIEGFTITVPLYIVGKWN